MNELPKLSKNFIMGSILKIFDEVQTKKQWGELNCTVCFQRGEVKYISPYFKPTIIEEDNNIK